MSDPNEEYNKRFLDKMAEIHEKVEIETSFDGIEIEEIYRATYKDMLWRYEQFMSLVSEDKRSEFRDKTTEVLVTIVMDVHKQLWKQHTELTEKMQNIISQLIYPTKGN